jgi:hypothetical protein
MGKKQWHILLSILIFALPLNSCQKIETTAIKYNLNIAKIKDLSQQKRINAKVYLKGKVINTAPFLGTGAYELQDKTASMWIFSKESLPVVGKNLTIRGEVKYQSITVNAMKNEDFGDFYINEIQRLPEENESPTPTP